MQCLQIKPILRSVCLFGFAMAPKRKPEELGVVVEESGAYRARIYIHETNLPRNIRGPRHIDQKAAFKDLLAIRAAAAEHTMRMGALQAM